MNKLDQIRTLTDSQLDDRKWPFYQAMIKGAGESLRRDLAFAKMDAETKTLDALKQLTKATDEGSAKAIWKRLAELRVEAKRLDELERDHQFTLNDTFQEMPEEKPAK